MLRVKRIVAFTMAMIISASLCLVVNAERWEELLNSGVSSAKAWAKINDWAIEENWTDLEAGTEACVDDYEDIEGFYNVSAYVYLSTLLSDMYTAYNTRDYIDSETGEVVLQALVDGNDCLNSDVDPYFIVEFSSYHEVIVYYDHIDPEQDVWVEDWYCDGSTWLGTTS